MAGSLRHLLAGRELTPEEERKAFILGWCIEWVSGCGPSGCGLSGCGKNGCGREGTQFGRGEEGFHPPPSLMPSPMLGRLVWLPVYSKLGLALRQLSQIWTGNVIGYL